MFFGPCYLGSKGLQNTRKKIPSNGKASWELRMSKKAIFRQSFFLFFDGPAKNQQANVSEKCPKTLWKCLWTTYKNYTKKNEIKMKKNGQKGTKESKLSLGSWLAFWAANTACTCMLDITFKL